MPRGFSLKSKPFEVVSVVQGRAGGTSTTKHETFDKIEDATKRAEKVAKEKNVRSVYVRHLDAYGEIVKTDVIKKYVHLS